MKNNDKKPQILRKKFNKFIVGTDKERQHPSNG